VTHFHVKKQKSWLLLPTGTELTSWLLLPTGVIMATDTGTKVDAIAV
jgi:hypothetical protein